MREGRREKGGIKVGGEGRQGAWIWINQSLLLSLLCANVNKSPFGNTVNQFDCSVKHLQQQRRNVLQLNSPPVFCQPPWGGNCPGPVGSAFSPVVSQVEPRLPPNPHPTRSWPVAEGPRLSGEDEANKPPRGAAGAVLLVCYHNDNDTQQWGCSARGPRIQTMSAMRRLLRETEKIKNICSARTGSSCKAKTPLGPSPFLLWHQVPSLHPTRFHRRRDTRWKGGPEWRGRSGERSQRGEKKASQASRCECFVCSGPEILPTEDKLQVKKPRVRWYYVPASRGRQNSQHESRTVGNAEPVSQGKPALFSPPPLKRMPGTSLGSEYWWKTHASLVKGK